MNPRKKNNKAKRRNNASRPSQPRAGAEIAAQNAQLLDQLASELLSTEPFATSEDNPAAYVPEETVLEELRPESSVVEASATAYEQVTEQYGQVADEYGQVAGEYGQPTEAHAHPAEEQGGVADAVAQPYGVTHAELEIHEVAETQGLPWETQTPQETTLQNDDGPEEAATREPERDFWEEDTPQVQDFTWDEQTPNVETQDWNAHVQQPIEESQTLAQEQYQEEHTHYQEEIENQHQGNELWEENPQQMPWENTQEAGLPWEENQPTVEQSMPWDQQLEQIALVAESTQQDAHDEPVLEQAQEQETLDWLHQSTNEPGSTPSEQETAIDANQETNLPWEENPDDSHWTQGQEQELPWETEQNEEIPWESEVVENEQKMPWDAEAPLQQEELFAPPNEAWDGTEASDYFGEAGRLVIIHSLDTNNTAPVEEALFLGDDEFLDDPEEETRTVDSVLPQENEFEEDYQEGPLTASLDDAPLDSELSQEPPIEEPSFLNDEESFIIDEPAPESDQPEQTTVAEVQPAETIDAEENQKLKAMELLDLDDDLLDDDDDFLDDDKPVVPEVPVLQTISPRRQYIPTAPVAPPQFVTKAPAPLDIRVKLDQAKKKNDAYDFPIPFNLARHPVKPASRAISSISAAPASSAPPIHHGPKGTETASKHNSNPILSQPVVATPTKSFFEELPITVPTPTARPVRAAAPQVYAPSSSAPQIIEPPLVPIPKKSAKNPYAALASKANNSPRFNNAQPVVQPVASMPAEPASKYQPQQQAPIPMGYPGQHAAPPGPLKTQAPIGSLPPPKIGSLPPGPPQILGYPIQNQPQGLQQGYQQGYQQGTQQGIYDGMPQTGAGFQRGFNQNPPLNQGQTGQYAPMGQATAPPMQGYAPVGQVAAPTNQAYAPVGQVQPGMGGAIPPFLLPQQAQPFPKTELHVPPKSPRTNVAAAQKTEKSSTLSPYVPASGPYAPSNRGHSRTSSIIGGKGKEVNPYAPAQPGPAKSTGGFTQPGQPIRPVHQVMGQPMHPAHPVGPPHHGQYNNAHPVPGHSAPQAYPARGNSSSINSAPAPTVQNPMALLERQFPIFHWGSSQKVVCLIPQLPVGSFDPIVRAVQVTSVSNKLPNLSFYGDFPGPLSRSKSKKKEVETWLDSNIEKLESSFASPDELLLCQVLRSLVKNEGHFKSPSFIKEVASILTPNIDYSVETKPGAFLAHGIQNPANANAFKLDGQGVNTVWSMIQTGNTEGALEYALSKNDWALGFIIAHSISPERFAKLASDYARNMFPFQKTQGTKAQHLMPVMMKIFAGNYKGVIEDFMNIPAETEFAKTHYREIIAAAIANKCNSEFLVEYGKFLSTTGLDTASEICFVIAGIIMSRAPLANGAVFSLVGASTHSLVYSEIYEYVLQISSATANAIPPTGLPHLITLKIRRAQVLADFGLFHESRRYCDQLSATLKSLGKSPFVSPSTILEFQNLLVRLSDTSSSDAGWLGSKFSKVNLDKMWGHLDKFIGGDEVAAKAGENGVFSKFSPTISRNASALDVSQIVNALPPFHNGFREPVRSSSYAYAPTTSEFTSPSQNSTRSQAPQKYAPGVLASNSMKPAALQSPYSGQQQNGLAFKPKLAPNNASFSSLNVMESTPRTEERKPALGSGSTSSRNPYGNRNHNLSSLSIGSHVSTAPIHNAYMHPVQQQGALETNSYEYHRYTDNTFVANSVMLNMPQGIPHGHARTSSLQSEISDVPDHYGAPQRSDTIVELPGNSSRRSSEPLRIIPKTTSLPEEYSEDANYNTTIPGPGSSVKEEEDIMEEINVAPEPKFEEEVQDVLELTPPPPPISTSKSVPQRVNPYAPGASRTNTRTESRYGPPTMKTNKYASPQKVSTEVNLMGGATDVSYGDAFGYKPAPVQVPVAPKEEVKVDEPKSQPERTQSPPAPPVSAHVPTNRLPPRRNEPRGNPYAPTKPRVANVDVSFDSEVPEETFDTSLREPEALILNAASSPKAQAQDEYVNPFQNDGRGKHPFEKGLDEFSIPGSPEYTTRANSVIGQNGLYSSRLSQSHQSVLYQQYEVKDDTVREYIPVPEEDDEDEEDIRARKEAEKKEAEKKEAERKEAERKEAERKEEEKKAKSKAGDDSNGWFKWRSGKADDKPKAIRAKMGQASTFKYDDKLKRWIDTSRPLDEQLQAAAPPPPPKKKEVKKEAAPPTGPPQPTGPSQPTTAAPAAALPPTGAPRPAARSAPARNLANAGLDDLLSLSGSTPTPGGGGRKGKRRYVNVMETGT